MLPNSRHRHHLLEGDSISARTQPSTPRRQRNNSFSPSSASTLSTLHHVLQSQNSVAIDAPIECLDPTLREDEEDPPPTILEDFQPRESLYTAYLRRRLREFRPCSLDDGTLQKYQSTKSGLASQRRSRFVARAISVDNPYFDEVQGELEYVPELEACLKSLFKAELSKGNIKVSKAQRAYAHPFASARAAESARPTSRIWPH
ncbi:hypothetical protein Aperf_G00000061372 [Anoplocephala perfoliata]